MKSKKLKDFKFRIDINLKVIAKIRAKSLQEAMEKVETMTADEMLNHEINDVSTIYIKEWN